MAERTDEPAYGAFSITPTDNSYLAQQARGIYVGGAGDVVLKPRESATTVTFVGVVAGTIIPVWTEQVFATGTTATNLIGLT